MDTDLSLASAGIVNVLRYHPMPHGKNAVQLANLESNGDSTLQSCGKSTVRQAESSNDASAAFGSSPWKNFHSSISSVSRASSVASAAGAALSNVATATAARNPKATEVRIGPARFL